MSNSQSNQNPRAIISVSNGNPVIQGVKLDTGGDLSIFHGNFYGNTPQRNFSLEPHRRGEVKYFASKKLPRLSFERFVFLLNVTVSDASTGEETEALVQYLKKNAPTDLADFVRKTDKPATIKGDAVWCDGIRYRYIIPEQMCLAWSERDGFGVSYVMPYALTNTNSRKLSLLQMRIEQLIISDRLEGSTQSGCYPEWADAPLE
jgi:hypothetical protein